MPPPDGLTWHVLQVAPVRTAKRGMAAAVPGERAIRSATARPPALLAISGLVILDAHVLGQAELRMVGAIDGVRLAVVGAMNERRAGTRSFALFVGRALTAAHVGSF